MITKIIWTYWHQGWEQAPNLVKQCRNSWISLNPDYEIRALDQNSLFNYIDFPKGIDTQRKDITIQKISALGRLALLSKYGGVWTDATVICVQSLSQWLEEYYASRFFAFRNPGKDRLISNWFIAAESENVIIKRLYKSFLDFYTENYFSNQNTLLGNMLLKYCNRYWSSDLKATLKWHSWFVRKVLRIYPYFIFHYTFNKLILTDQECGALWHQAKPYLAESPHRLQHLVMSSNRIEEATKEINSRIVPMYKLDWRADTSTGYWATILRLLEAQL